MRRTLTSFLFLSLAAGCGDTSKDDDDDDWSDEPTDADGWGSTDAGSSGGSTDGETSSATGGETDGSADADTGDVDDSADGGDSGDVDDSSDDGTGGETDEGGGSDDGSDDGGTTGSGSDADADADAGPDDTAAPLSTDEDGDGYALEDGDCDDADPTIYPGADEIWGDGIDQDCDGVADVEDASCSAELTVTMPDGSVTVLDGCTDWNFDVAFEYDPDDPPEVNSFTLDLGATTEADFDCRIQLTQYGVCGPGYFDERDETTTTRVVLMDCSGVIDEYERTYTSHEGYLRIDTIEAGTEPGSFAGEPLPTTVEGHLHTWTPEGVDIQGTLAFTLVQIAGDSEEVEVCANVADAVLDADGDGVMNWHFDGDDCDDTDALLGSMSTDADCDGIITIEDCDDGDTRLGAIASDEDCDGTVTEDDADDTDASYAAADEWTLPDGVDIIFFADQSGSMEDDVSALAAAFPSFVDEIEEWTSDWQVIVANQDNGCNNTGGILDPTFSDYETRFGSAISSGGGWYTEAGLTVTSEAVEQTDPGECNAGLLREGAALHIIMMSDESEQSTSSWDWYVDRIAAKKGSIDDVMFSAIAGDWPGGCATADPGEGYHQAVTATDGVFLSICSDWAVPSNLSMLAMAPFGRYGFRLSAAAVIESIVVKVNGIERTEGWTYDADTTTILFDDPSPTAGDTVTVYYLPAL